MKEFIIKNKSIIFIVIFSLTSIIVFNIYRNLLNYKPVELDEVKLKDEIKIDKSKTLAIMLQNDEGEYTESESSVFPTSGYRFNSTRSGCVDANGNIIENALTYNNETNKVNLRINKKVKCYTYFDKLYTISYDLNGGEFESEPPVKEVVYSDEYGDLPEPTKTGYTFKGWNGRNYYNVNDTINVTQGYTKDNNDWISLNTSSGDYNYSYWTHNLNVLENEQYTFALEINKVSNITGYFHITSIQNTTAGNNWQFNNKVISSSELIPNSINIYNIKTTETVSGDEGLRTFYNNSNYDTNGILTFRISVLDVDDTITSDNFEYEPYYIESDTKVVQRQNHTLKAIWEENS